MSFLKKIAAVKTGDLDALALCLYDCILIRKLWGKYLWESKKRWDLLGGAEALVVLWIPKSLMKYGADGGSIRDQVINIFSK